MHVKTYTGPSAQEVLAQIKEELGSDAIILSSRSFRKGDERLHEVTAGIERLTNVNALTSEGMALENMRPGSTGTVASRSESARVREQAEAILAGKSPGGQSTGSINAQASASALSALSGLSALANSGPLGTPGMPHPPGWSEWHKEWLQIKEHLFALMKPSIQLERLTPRQRVALEYLQREGISDVVALELYRRLLLAPGASVLASLSELVPVLSWDKENWEQRIQCFVGPFGVGKTTAALRMALMLRARHADMRIAFINADCLRGNGRLILRHWAELSDFAYVEVQDKQSMEKALISQAHADRIFIDMPGVAQDSTLAAQYALLGIEGDLAGQKASHVVLSPTYEGTQLAAFLQRYAPDGAGSLVWGKLDEAISYGSLVNVAVACGLPVSALSFGAELRGTLVPATESLLWRLIFKRQLPS